MVSAKISFLSEIMECEHMKTVLNTISMKNSTIY